MHERLSFATHQFFPDVFSAWVESDDVLFDRRLDAENVAVFFEDVKWCVDFQVRRLFVQRRLEIFEPLDYWATLFFLLQAQSACLFLFTCVMPHTPADGAAMIFIPPTLIPQWGIELVSAQLHLHKGP